MQTPLHGVTVSLEFSHTLPFFPGVTTEPRQSCSSMSACGQTQKSPDDSQGGLGLSCFGHPSVYSLMSQFPFGFSMNFNSQWYMTEALNKRAKLFGRSANSLHPQCKCKHLPIACTAMAFLMPLVLDMLPTHRTKADPTGSNGFLSASHPPFLLQPLPDLLLLSQRDRERCLHSPPGHNLSCLRLTPTY